MWPAAILTQQTREQTPPDRVMVHGRERHASAQVESRGYGIHTTAIGIALLGGTGRR